MVRIDQKVRKFQLKSFNKLLKKYGNINESGFKKEIKKLSKELESVDKANTSELKKIIKTYGWPGNSLVGKKGAFHAWLLAQHADKDLKF